MQKVFIIYLITEYLDLMKSGVHLQFAMLLMICTVKQSELTTTILNSLPPACQRKITMLLKGDNLIAAHRQNWLLTVLLYKSSEL